MKIQFSTRLLAVVGALLLGLSLMSITALAHESRNVDKYKLTVGFFTEPALEGQKNGIDLRVSNVSDAASPKPVTGLEKIIQVEITHVPSNTTKTFAIRALFNDAGHYTNDLIMTAPGQYKFRFFGAVEGVNVNETFTSGPGTFGDVQSTADMQFPQQLPQIREVSAAVQGAQNTAQNAETSAQRGTIMSIIALVLGAVGIATGAAALASRKK